jgi:hypothetical protein
MALAPVTAPAPAQQLSRDKHPGKDIATVTVSKQHGIMVTSEAWAHANARTQSLQTSFAKPISVKCFPEYGLTPGSAGSGEKALVAHEASVLFTVRDIERLRDTTPGVRAGFTLLCLRQELEIDSLAWGLEWEMVVGYLLPRRGQIVGGFKKQIREIFVLEGKGAGVPVDRPDPHYQEYPFGWSVPLALASETLHTCTIELGYIRESLLMGRTFSFLGRGGADES